MSFVDYLDKKVLEEAVSSFRYTMKIKNIKELFHHIAKWKHNDYLPIMEHTKAIGIYDRDSNVKGTIKDKGKSFEMDNPLTKDKVFKTYTEQGL